MPDIVMTDEEIIDFIMGLFYSDGQYQHIDYYYIGASLQDANIHTWDSERLWRQLQTLGLIKVSSRNLSLYQLSDKGMSLMRKYNSYANYLKAERGKTEKKEKIERNDRRVKNIGILTTLGVSLLTLILTQCPIRKDKEQETIREDIQSIAKKLDSIKQALPDNQISTENKAAKDTATSK
jgi:hypothetical protein